MFAIVQPSKQIKQIAMSSSAATAVDAPTMKAELETLAKIVRELVTRIKSIEEELDSRLSEETLEEDMNDIAQAVVDANDSDYDSADDKSDASGDKDSPKRSIKLVADSSDADAKDSEDKLVA
jgi:Rad3-related DNA helicase